MNNKIPSQEPTTTSTTEMPTDTLVSYILVCYNQERFVRDAVRSAILQTYEPLEIIISDDCSPDQTYDLILEETAGYRGPHSITLNRNKTNLGLAGNLNCAYSLAKGAFFVLAAGDDISVPTRTKMLVNRWQNSKDPADLICSYFSEINETGKPTGYIKENVVFVPDTSKRVSLWECGATGACVGFNRMLYDKYGPLHPDVIAEDWIFAFRAWLESGVALIKEPLVQHRTHNNSISVRHRNKKLSKSLRKEFDFGRLARASEWLKAWEIAGKGNEEHIIKEFQEWISLLELNCSVHNSNRIQALKAALKSLRYRGGGGGGKNALKILLRNVLRLPC